MFLKYYQGLDVPGATPGDRTETCASADRSQMAETKRGLGRAIHPTCCDLGDSTLSTPELQESRVPLWRSCPGGWV